MKRFFAALFTILGAITALGIFFTNKVMYLKKKTEEEVLERETKKHFRIEDFDALHKEEIHIPSQFDMISTDITFLPIIPTNL